MGSGGRIHGLVGGLLGCAATVSLFLATTAVAAPLTGTLDRSFGHNGRVSYPGASTFGGSEFTSMVRQPDGKLVLSVTIHAQLARMRAVVQRRNPDGRLDSGFGDGGMVIAPRGSSVRALAMKTDGRILFSVARGNCDRTSTMHSLHPNGTPDRSFGAEGVSAAVPLFAEQIAVDADGRVFLAGYLMHNSCSTKGPPPRSELAIARLQANGVLDSSFGNGGIARPHEDRFEDSFATGLAIREDGTALVASNLSLLRLRADGALDSNFAGDGFAEAEAGSPKALLPLPGGEAVLVSSNSNSVFRSCCWMPGDFVLSRYRADGTLNTDFGADGHAVTDLGELDEGSALALSPDGRIVLAGGVADEEDCEPGDCAFKPILARFTLDGALDSSFGQGGLSPIDPPGEPAGHDYVPRIAALTIAPNGQILAAGGAGREADAFVVARKPDGQADPSFGHDGSVSETHTLPSWTEPLSLTVKPKGKILISASSNIGSHTHRSILLGLLPNGRPDPGIDSGAGFVPLRTWGSVGADARGFPYLVGEDSVARLDHRGLDDPRYGSDGVAHLPTGFAVGSFLIRGDGKVLVVGHIDHGGMAALQLTRRGAPDRSFGNDGLAVVRFGRKGAEARSVAIDSRGRILLVGTATGGKMAATRLLTDGRLDRRFGRHGRLMNLQSSGTQVIDVALQGNGGILIATSFGSMRRNSPTSLLRLRDSGARDRSFSRGGVLRIGGKAQLLSVFATGRRIILVTKRGYFGGGGFGMDLRAYRANGRVDRSFGRNGILATTAPEKRAFRPIAAARQPDGRILVVGRARRPNKGGTTVELLRFR